MARKKSMAALVLAALCGTGVFAVDLPTVAVATFDVMGGVTKDEAQVITELFMTELVSKGTVNVVDRVNFDKIIAEMKFQASDWSDSQKTAALGSALNAQYVIRGQLMKMGSVIYWTATMLDIKTAQVLYSAREQIDDLGQVWGKLPGFCAQMLTNLPAPNYFIGKWRSSNGNYICILDFKANGSIVVERYEIYDSGKTAFTGTGNYSFDNAAIRISLQLKSNSQTQAIQTTPSYTFDGPKNSFTLRNGLLWVRTGDSAYYTTFIKMQ
jgi:TolB-like protein